MLLRTIFATLADVACAGTTGRQKKARRDEARY
jgi:hypothetical protein